MIYPSSPLYYDLYSIDAEIYFTVIEIDYVNLILPCSYIGYESYI